MKHNNRFIQCIIFSLISLILSQEKIAIIPFTPNGVDDITAMEITSRFTFELSKTNRYDIIEREMMNKILDEQKFQTSGCVTDTCIVEIGQLIGVKKIVAGSVSKIENLYTINIRLIDVATGQILHHGMGSFEESIKDFLNITVKNTALKMAAETTTILGDNDGSTGQYSSTKTGNIIFNINKLGVAIYLDGRYNSIGTGNTVSFTLTEGTHDIKFSLSGFRDWQKEISIIAGEQLVYDVEMRTGLSTEGQAVNLTGILLVYSDPDGATVFVDGVNKGTTLLQITDIGSGTHEIRVEKNLYFNILKLLR
ncbi:MAG: PEGA domain-containing protein [Candidatus Marinimicrobia bacterium]|nr:PEGA domain-containing protein [Candidatus Neomarinimicrobiota bacterium]